MLEKIIDKRNYIILFIIIILLIIILIPKHKTKEYIKSFYYLDQTITMKIYTKEDPEKIFKNINSIYKKYNNYYQNSYKDKGFKELMQYGKYVYKQTDGLVDISAGKLVKNIKENKEYKNDSDINNPDLENLNLSVIIGTYATNKVINYLENNGIDQYIINTDGNISAGSKINNDKYKVGIINKDGKMLDIAYIENTNLAIKGNTKEFKSYMVNPKTNKKVNNKLVVVIDDDLNEANYIANALYLMSVKEGKEFIKKYQAQAYWKENKKVYTTKDFKKYLKE